jgi:mannose-6-phosphate isomerase
MIAYPLFFKPIFKERIWGGQNLKSFLNKPITGELIGESWELSAVPNDESIISNGAYEGQTITDLIKEFPQELLGKDVYQKYGASLPLLFKYIDAKEDLSIQVHPNDTLAQERHNSFGKTEMWYVMHAEEDARLVVGFKKDSNEKEYIQHLETKSLSNILNEIPVKKGDVFFLETGTIHAIGAGCMIAEIQQTSDITYRIYDWDRVDANGNGRELHTELALKAMNYNYIDAKVDYKMLSDKSNEVISCDYFNTNIIPLDTNYNWVNRDTDFTVFMCVEGSFEIIFNLEKFQVNLGDTVFIPAVIEKLEINGKATILEVTA